jgi:hypothetical protein
MDLRQDQKKKQIQRSTNHYFCCCAPNTDGVVVMPLFDEVPAAASPKADKPKGDDWGIVVVAGVCPNPNKNVPDPDAGVPLGVVVVAAGVLVWLFVANEKLGVVVVLVTLALVVEADAGVPFLNTTLLGVCVELPNTLPPNKFRVWVCGIPKGEGVVTVLFENAVFVLPSPNTDF